MALSYSRPIIIIAVLTLLLGCSTRQAFNESSDNSTGWWKCDPKSEREWRCTDGNKVSETRDVITDLSDVSNEPQPATQEKDQKEFTALDSIEQKPIEQEVVQPELTEEGLVDSEESIVAVEDVIAPSIGPQDTLKDSTPNEKQSRGDWLVQLGAFRSELEARRLADKVPNSKVDSSSDDNWYRVVWGAFFSREAAEQAASELKQEYSNINTWVRKD